MSIDSIRIRCNGCDYKYLENFKPITLKCRMGEDVVTYYRTTAWCNRCDSIRYVECIPSAEEIRDEYEKFEAPFVNHQQSLFRKYFRLLFGNATSSKDENKKRESIKKLENQIAWRKARIAPACCLTCGTTDLTPIDFESVNDNMKVTRKFRHSCGGQLVIEENDNPGIRFHFSNSVIWMDIEGNKLVDDS